MSFLAGIDEKMLSQTERLALAWYRLNLGEWDEYIGKKPEGFDSLEPYFPARPLTGRRALCRYYYTRPVMQVIEETIGMFSILQFIDAHVPPRPDPNFVQWYFSPDTLMISRSELFPKPCRPPLLWRLRRKAQQVISRLRANRQRT